MNEVMKVVLDSFERELIELTAIENQLDSEDAQNRIDTLYEFLQNLIMNMKCTDESFSNLACCLYEHYSEKLN